MDSLDSLDTLDTPEMVTVISPNGSTYTVKKNCIFPMSAFSSLLPLDCYGDGGIHRTPLIDLQKSDPGFPIPDDFIATACEFLNTRNGVDLDVVKPGEKFGYRRKEHDLMNPLYISDCWRDSIKGRNEWLASIGERFVPDPVLDASIPKTIPGPDGKEIPNPEYTRMFEEALAPAFQHGMRMVRVAEWFGVTGIHHLVCARVKFITRSFLGKKDEWHAFCEKYKPGIANWPCRVVPAEVVVTTSEAS